jgi:protein SCO1/2
VWDNRKAADYASPRIFTAIRSSSFRMEFPVSSKVLTIIVAVAAALFGLLVASLWLAPQMVDMKSGTLLQQRRELAKFSLLRDNGQAFTRADLQGHWTLIFPGYTYCPDVCPTTLAFLKTLHEKLKASGQTVNVVFLSVDPARDTPERLASYVHYFNPDFVGVTAQEPELGRFTQMLGIAYAKVPGSAGTLAYTMDHSAALILLDPQARIAAYFSPPHKLEEMSADLGAVMGAKL